MTVPLSPGLVVDTTQPIAPLFRSVVLTTDDLGAVLVKGRPCSCAQRAGQVGHRYPQAALDCAGRRSAAFIVADRARARLEANAADLADLEAAGLTYPPAEAARLEALGGEA